MLCCLPPNCLYVTYAAHRICRVLIFLGPSLLSITFPVFNFLPYAQRWSLQPLPKTDGLCNLPHPNCASPLTLLCLRCSRREKLLWTSRRKHSSNGHASPRLQLSLPLLLFLLNSSEFSNSTPLHILAFSQATLSFLFPFLFRCVLLTIYTNVGHTCGVYLRLYAHAIAGTTPN